MNLGKTYYQMAQAEKNDTAIQNELYRKAENVFVRTTEIETDNVQAYLWRANTAFSLDPESKLESTREKYFKVIEVGLTDTVKHAKELFDAYSYMGSSYLFADKPDYNKAEEFFSKIITIDPKNKQWVLRGYSSLGIIHTKKKNYPLAIEYYKKALELDPKNDSYQKTIDGINKAIKDQQNR
jgi:tetratricopeptide (TPR) repeat protein